MRLLAGLLFLSALVNEAGARGKRGKAKRGGGGGGGSGATASHTLLEALERSRNGDEAGARQLASVAMAQYQMQGNQPSLTPILVQAERTLGFELALQHLLLPAMEMPAQAVERMVGNEQVWQHLDKGPHGTFLVQKAKPVSVRPYTSAPELAELRVGRLLEIGRTQGVAEETLDAAMDEDDPRAAVTELILALGPSDAAARTAALCRGLDGLQVYKSREYDTGRKLLLEAIELRSPSGSSERLLLLLYWAEKKVGFELAVTFYLLPFLGLPAAALSDISDQWLSPEDKAPIAQFLKMLKSFPDLQDRAAEDVFLTTNTMELIDRCLLAGRAAEVPGEDAAAGYVAVAKDDDTGVRSTGFHANQYRHLLDNGLIDQGFEATWRGYVTMREAMEGPKVQEIMSYGQEKKAAGFIIPEMRKQYDLPAMPTAFGRVNYRRPTPAVLLQGSALHPHMVETSAHIDDLQTQFDANNGIAVADDVLSPEVVEELWRFCIESTVYFATKKGGIYMGGYAKHGFTSPLILKVASEIKESFPAIFNEEDHLTDFWVYNYDNNDLLSGGEDGGASEKSCKIMTQAEEGLQRLTAEAMKARSAADGAPNDEALQTALIEKEIELQSFRVKRNAGIDMHADPARITVNMWLTPDEANLDPESGGLMVYKKNVPKGASFSDYVLKSGKKVWEQISVEDEAEKMKVTYKRGRMLIFKSHRLHHTDECSWKKGYKERRINLTLLFGRNNWKQYDL